MQNEAHARIKINKLLNEAGWRFLEENGKSANVVLELNAKLTLNQLEEAGKDFENSPKGYIDYLLLDNNGYPFIVLEAKKEAVIHLPQKNKQGDTLRLKTADL